MSEKMIPIRGKQVSEDTIVEALQKHCDFDKPKMVWITEEEAGREGKKSLLAAVEVSIKKWRQIYAVSDEELLAVGQSIIADKYCGLCHRFLAKYGNKTTCSDCLLCDDTTSSAFANCCREWKVCCPAWGNWPKFRPAALKMIERLEKERDKLLKPKPYVFQAGDVATCEGSIRIIVQSRDSEMLAFNERGTWETVRGQAGFEAYGYKKIGVLSDFIKRP